MHVPRAMAHNGPAPTITASPTGGSSPAAGVRCVPAGVALLGGGGAEGAPPGWTFFPGLDSPGGDIGLAPAPALAHLATGSVSSQQQDPPAPPSPASAQQAGAGAAEADGSSGAGGEMSGIASLCEAMVCAQSRLAGLRLQAGQQQEQTLNLALGP